MLTGLLSFYQNGKSEAIMETLKQLSKAKILVVRQSSGGHEQKDLDQQLINSADLVIGDVICIKDGQKIPADLRVMKFTSFKLDNSSLTVLII